MTQAPPRRPRGPAVALSPPRGTRPGRPARPAPARPAGPGRTDLVGVRTAGLAALTALGLLLIVVELVCLALWALESQSQVPATSVLRTGVDIVLAAHHTGLQLAGGTVLGVVPYPLTLIAGAVLWRGGRRVALARAAAGVPDAGSGRDVARVAAMVAACYAPLVTAVCVVGRQPGVRPLWGQALAGSLALAGLAAGAGAWRASGWAPDTDGLPVPDLRASVRGAVVAGSALLTAATALGAAAVLLHFHQLAATSHVLGPSVGGATGLGLLDILLVPHLVVWSGAVAAGPGVGLGLHSSVSLLHVHVGQLPALPVLGALPVHDLPAAARALVLLPVAAGVLAGARLPGWRAALQAALGAGLLWGLLCALADGSAGPGRLAETGPSPWRVALAVTVEVAVGALAAVGVRAVRLRRPAA